MRTILQIVNPLVINGYYEDCLADKIAGKQFTILQIGNIVNIFR
jgi:hypothetical protein